MPPAIPDPLAGLDLKPGATVALAVSGGGDSMALAGLAVASPVRHALGLDLLCITVDHGLRAEAADEARMVAGFCASQGMRHATLSWDSVKPETGLQAAARDARYDLVARCAVAWGAVCVLTAHTLDDQRETVAMRARRGEGEGLGGIAPATRTMGAAKVWFVRPFLETGREALRCWLAGRGIGWAEDPSNTALRFERVRQRAALSAMSGALLAELDRMQQAAAAGRLRADHLTAAWIDAFAEEAGPGVVRLDPAGFDGDPESAARALRLLTAFVAGRDRPGDPDKAAALTERLATSGRFTASYGGTVITAQAAGIYLRREGRRRTAAPSAGMRYRLSDAATASGPDAASPAFARLLERFYGDVPKGVARAALAVEPFADTGSGPELAWNLARDRRGVVRSHNPWPCLLPAFDLASARAIARLAGLGDIPAPPLLRPEPDHQSATI